MRAISAVVTVFLSATSLFAQAPGWSRGQQSLAINYEECVRRAPLALTAEGYRIDYAAGAFAVGLKGVHTAVVMCTPGADGKLVVNIVVASNGEGGGTERQQLQAQMERSTPGGTTAGGTNPGSAVAGRYLTVSLDGRRAVVDWAGAPTTDRAWVSIVPAGTADGSHVGRWVYTESKSAGRFVNGPLEVGAYEARFYADGGYGAIVDRVRFDVKDEIAGQAGRYINVQVDGRRFAILNWSNAPTTKGAWVSIVPVGTPDGSHVGRWAYTNEAPSGRYESGPLTPGEYEARFYGDGGYSALVDRIRFRVN
jgi:hypothetical protein